ncbi:hypothetical protein PV691_33755, partial [Streptomyces sp. AK08-01A]|nr:hypothetical protein [Streptomyces sp. AK08-01A]
TPHRTTGRRTAGRVPTTGLPTTAAPTATDGTPPPVAYPHPVAAVEAAPVGTTYDADDSGAPGGTTYDADDSPAGRSARPR